jgi:hypothetical protein
MATISAALAALAQADFPLLIIGGNALEAYQLARPTFDTDCMIAVENKERLREVLGNAGYRWIATFASFQEFRFKGDMDTAPIHAMCVEAETFEKMWARSVPHTYGGSQLRVPAIAHLIALKLHAVKNTPERQGKDMRDIIHLLELNRGVVSKDELRQLCTRYASAESIRQFEVLHFL